MYPGTHAAAHPDKPAIVMDQSGESVSYAQLEDRSVRLANVLRDRGLRHGDVVALLADELRAFARTRLAGYKIPRAIDFRDELPRLPTGKLAKHVLRDEYRPVPSS
jgi:acyl-CoA synthetase (AMP-forming)/AMP-acid ligase II